MHKLTFPNDKFLPEIIDLINKGHLVTITARGNSMRPFIENGRDLLVFGKPDDVCVGDVVLAEVQDGHFVCHRIESIEDGVVVMRGDGNVPNSKLGWNGTESFTVDRLRAKLVRIDKKGRSYTLGTSRVWKLYSFMWVRLLPVRRYLLALYRLLWFGQIPGLISKKQKN